MRWPSIDPATWTTLRARLTLWNTGVVLLMTAASLAAVWLGARGALYRETDAVLIGNVREVAIAITDLYPDIDAVVAELQRRVKANAERAWFTHLLTEDGTTIWQSDLCPEAVASFPPSRKDRRENVVQVGPYRYARLAIDTAGHRPFHIRVGMSTESLDQNVRALMQLLLTVGLALSLLTPLAGYWLAVRATRPVSAILATAERLRPTRLGDRLAESGAGDELDRLSVTINRLLDQVATHVERQEQFVADAAHELRGPLTGMQSALEVAVSQDRSAAEYRETLVDVLEAAQHLSKLANDLLLLAESGAASVPNVRESVDLAGVAAQAVAMFAGVAEERGVSLELIPRSRPVVGGDTGRLRQVVGNLLDNALRFTPRGGRVVVTVADEGAAGGAITVQDTGSGIVAADLERIFDRFWMADPARSHAESRRSGGLGLAICKSVVEGCGGGITVASRPGAGTTATVRLPLWPTTAPGRVASRAAAPANR
jgi:two-component system heavy metal sensor histidine kinase CusS